MKPLRVVKPRTERIETDQDLRGLSEESFFKHSNPLSVLTVQCDSEVAQPISSILETHYPSLEYFYEGKALHISGRKEHNENFKQDLVELYSLSLALADTLPRTAPVHMSLWVFDQMRFHMQRSVDGKPTVDTVEAIKLSSPSSSHFLNVSQRCMSYLHQAGFSRVPSSGSEWHLSQSEAKSLFATEQSALESVAGQTFTKKAI